MNWFAKSGDKLLSLITVALGLINVSPAETAALGLSPRAVAWGLIVSAIATAAHTIYYPNTQGVPGVVTKIGGFARVSLLGMLTLACAVALALSGCATLTSLVTSPQAPTVFAVTADAAVGVAVGKGVPAQTIANIASELKAFDSGTTTTIPALTSELNKLESISNLNAAEIAAASVLVTAFDGVIQTQVSNGTVNATAQATIQQVLGDVISAAELFGATAPAAPAPVPATQTTAPQAHSVTVMSTIESPAAVGAATSALIIGALQAFRHVSVGGPAAAGLTVLLTLSAAYLQL